MKKVLALIIAAIMAFSLAACGGGSDSDAGDADGSAAENKKIIEKEMMRVGVEFLTDEEVRDRFPGAYMWMKSAELNQYGPAHWLGMSLMIAIPLIVIAIPFVIGPLAAKHRRKKEARQAENSQDI